MQNDGEYTKIDLRGKNKIDSQVVMMEEAMEECAKHDEEEQITSFIPREKPEDY